MSRPLSIRPSTGDQSLDRQCDELTTAGAEMVYSEVGSGKKGAIRPKWDELGRSLRSGDTLMVTELSRLGRSTSQLSALADDLRERGVALRTLNLGIDTGTPAGKLVYSIIAAGGADGARRTDRAHQLWIGCSACQGSFWGSQERILTRCPQEGAGAIRRGRR